MKKSKLASICLYTALGIILLVIVNYIIMFNAPSPFAFVKVMSWASNPLLILSVAIFIISIISLIRVLASKKQLKGLAKSIIALILSVIAFIGIFKQSVLVEAIISVDKIQDTEIFEGVKGKSSSETTTDKIAKGNTGDTELFGVPIKTEDYFIEDFSDPNNQYMLKQMGGRVVGMDGYIIIADKEDEEKGEYRKGSSFFIYAKDGKALIIKDITYLDETFIISLQEVEKGTPQSHEKLCIAAQKPFKGQTIKYEDGTELRNITLLDKEVGIERVEGEFQKVDGDKVDIIPSDSTLVKTYTMDGVTPESLEGLQKDDKIEYMRGVMNDTVYAIRKIGKE